MIEKYGRQYFELQCDFCSNSTDEQFEDFQEAVDYKKTYERVEE